MHKHKSCNMSVHKLLIRCVCTACSKLFEQVLNKLLTTCNKLDSSLYKSKLIVIASKKVQVREEWRHFRFVYMKYTENQSF